MGRLRREAMRRAFTIPCKSRRSGRSDAPCRLVPRVKGQKGNGRNTMFDWLHLTIPPAPALFAQLLVGLINGAFYAMLSLGLAVIFGLLNIINFAHGAQYMLGAFCAWFLLNTLGLGYWPALVLAPRSSA